MKSNNEQGGPTPPVSRSRVDASPTGRIVHAGPSPSFLLPAPEKLRAPRQDALARVDYSALELRVLATNPLAADHLKR